MNNNNIYHILIEDIQKNSKIIFVFASADTNLVYLTEIGDIIQVLQVIMSNLLVDQMCLGWNSKTKEENYDYN